MIKERVQLSTTLFQWLNRQTDLESHQVDLVDGFVFMLQKINKHKTIRLVNEQTLHPRFWRSHARAFGYKLTDKESVNLLYQFYVDVAFSERLIEKKSGSVEITAEGKQYLKVNKEEQLDCLFQHIW